MADILGTPKNAMEQEILDYINGRMTDELSRRIAKEKLTLKGCCESCFKKGKKFEIKSGSCGYAPITPEQHFKWVCAYFGIKYDEEKPTPKPQTVRTREKAENPEQLTFADLLDF